MYKKVISIILIIVSCLCIGTLFTACGDSSNNANNNDYSPGNPQYDYDSWKAQQWLNKNK